MGVKVPAAKLRGPFQKLLKKLEVVEFDAVQYSKKTKTGLASNQHYKYGKSAPGKPKYEYATDSQGRIRAAYTDNLQLKPKGQKRGPHNSKTPGKLPGDDAGHLFADQFDGGGEIPNLVSQLRSVNQGTWKDMEESWAKAITDGKRVEVFIEVGYGEGVRPKDFVVRYAVDGQEFVKEFVN